MKTITTLSEATPVEIDTKLSEFQQVEAQARIKYNRINASLTMSEADRARDFYRHSPYTTDDLDEAYNALADAIAKILPLEAEYNSRPWNRYYHVNNVNGHIHRNISCTSCYPDTQYLWRTDLSGLTDVEVVEREAYNACSVCMPIAPAEQKEARKRYNAEQREARRLEKEAKKDEKLKKKAERALKFLAKVEAIVEKNYGGWDKLFTEYSAHGHDGRKNLYRSTFDLQTTVGDYLMDEMKERNGERRWGTDPKAIVKEATDKGLLALVTKV